MSHIRQVIGLVHTLEGEPQAHYRYDFAVPSGTIKPHATISPTIVTTTADEDGMIDVWLEVDVTINVTEYMPIVREGGDRVRYRQGATYPIVVPDGDTPISMAMIRAAAITPPGDPTLVDFALTHMENTNNPHNVTAHQTGAYTTGEVDGLINDHRPEWGNIDGDIEAQQDLQDALDAIETTPGPPGPDGDSAYDVAVANGFVGSEEDWLASLVGEQGEPGEAGPPGNDGASAYEVAVSEGFEGSESDWLDSLVGEQGPVGQTGETGDTGPAGDPGPGVAAGGTEGQVLGKASSDDYDTEWIDTMIVVAHGDNAGTARPPAAAVYWIGAAEPEHGEDGDLWIGAIE